MDVIRWDIFKRAVIQRRLHVRVKYHSSLGFGLIKFISLGLVSNLKRDLQAHKKNTNLVDIFCEESVKNWSMVRIQCWEARKSNPEAFYYRFTGLLTL
jgi:hypothetical protein